MGVNVYPTPSSTSLPAFADSAVVTGIAPNNYYSTTLSAGNYVIKVSGMQNNTVASAYSVGTRLGSTNFIPANFTKLGESTYITLDTTETITLASNWYPFQLRTLTSNASSFNVGVGPSGVLGNGDVVFMAKATNDWTSIVSTDGITWSTAAATTVFTTGQMGQTIYGNQWLNDALFLGNGDVASTSNSTIARSTDGITWTRTTLTGISLGRVTCFSYGATGSLNYLMVSNNTATLNRNVTVSTDGITWTAASAGITTIATACASSPGAHVVVTSGGEVHSSTDGITWALRTTPLIAGTPLYNILYGNGIFLIPADNGDVIYSTDGTTWSFGVQAAPDVGAYQNNYRVVPSDDYNYTYTFDGTKFWLECQQGWAQYAGIYFSTDGITWDRSFAGTSNNESTSPWAGYTTPQYFRYSTTVGLFGASLLTYGTTSRPSIQFPLSNYVEIYNATGSTL